MTVRYEERESYLYVGIAGDFSPSAALDEFHICLKRVIGLHFKQILVDLTLIKDIGFLKVSIFQLYELSEQIAESLPIEINLAVLVNNRQKEGAMFCENVMCNRGARLKTTIDYMEALKWLGINTDHD